jgi:replication factor C small subunit
MLRNAREWTEKYRPRTLDEVIGQDRTIRILEKYAKLKFTETPNFLFYGSPGLGKTTTARAFTMAIHGEMHDVNSADYAGKDAIKELEQMTHRSWCDPHDIMIDLDTGLPSDHKYGMVYILDKAEAFYKKSKEALEKILESKNPRIKFILIVNDFAKMTAPLISRCVTMEFKPLSDQDMRKLINRIATEEKMRIPEPVVRQIIMESKGEARSAVRAMQQYYVMTK